MLQPRGLVPVLLALLLVLLLDAAVPTHAARDLPRLVQLLAREALGLAQRATDAIEQRFAGKSGEIVQCERVPAPGIEAHAGDDRRGLPPCVSRTTTALP